MVRLKIAYWEFDFEAVCPTLDHDLLSQAHMPPKQFLTSAPHQKAGLELGGVN